MKPIVFLDIDGVLAIYQDGDRTERTFVAEAVQHLNRLTAMTGASLVVSSSWRLRGDCRRRCTIHPPGG